MRILLLAYICLTGFSACHKDFLDKKTDERLVIPATISELQAVLDYDAYLNKNLPQQGEASADLHYMPDNLYTSLPYAYMRNLYTWSPDIYEGDRINTGKDWQTAYRVAMYANIALDGIGKINPSATEQPAWNNVKGSALFFRVFAFHLLTDIFAPAYDAATASEELATPLRLDPGIDLLSKKATVAETYSRMTTDLESAAALLPLTQLAKTRPSRAAAYILLARIYLQSARFDEARKAADSALKYNSELINFNKLTLTAARPMPVLASNPEILFYAQMEPGLVNNSSYRLVDTFFYKSFADNDLRKTGFFAKKTDGRSYNFKGNYDGTNQIFMGVATDEAYLTRAEAHARLGNKESALKDLNALAANRYAESGFAPFTASNADAALVLILEERKKELYTRGIRWGDLKRLNKEAVFKTTLKRTVNGKEYTLPPNDPRYVLPIPDEIIELSGLPQHKRT